MASVYPANVHPGFGTRVDNINEVVAYDVNSAYREIESIEATIGAMPQTPNFTGTWSESTAPYVNVSSRISNVEIGTKEAINNRVKTIGGSTISSAGTTVGLKINTSGTGNLLELGTNTVVNSSGVIVNIDGGGA